MAEKQITGLGQQAAPLDRRTKDSELFELLQVNATFDGTAAGGSWVPTVEVVSDSGEVVGTYPAATVLAVGDTASVTFAPFLRNGVGLTGIFYDVPNTGETLDIAVTGVNTATFDSLNVNVTGTGVTTLQTNGGGDLRIYQNNGFLDIQATHLALNHFQGSTKFDMFSAGGYAIRVQTGKSITFYRGTGSANPIFRIDANGDLHGLTGKALVFDL